MIDAIDKSYTECDEQFSSLGRRDNMRTVLTPSNENTLSSEYARKTKFELTDQTSGLPQQSKRFEMSMAKVHEFANQTKKYERYILLIDFIQIFRKYEVSLNINKFAI